MKYLVIGLAATALIGAYAGLTYAQYAPYSPIIITYPPSTGSAPTTHVLLANTGSAILVNTGVKLLVQ